MKLSVAQRADFMQFAALGPMLQTVTEDADFRACPFLILSRAAAFCKKAVSKHKA